MEKPKIFILLHNHFDLAWRRCWRRPFRWGGKTYQPYNVLESLVFDRWIDMAEKGTIKFDEGQAAILREYVAENPARLKRLRKLFKTGQFGMTGAGVGVPDTNIPSGESLVRNYLYGLKWVEKAFGKLPKIAWLEDSFGCSAQLPQILRGFGFRYAASLSYKVPQGDYWRGPDGTIIYIGSPWVFSPPLANDKIPPCPSCSGEGCLKCEDSGLDLSVILPEEAIRQGLNVIEFKGKKAALAHIGGEEVLPNPKVEDIVKELSCRDDAEYVFATYDDIMESLPEFPPSYENVPEEFISKDVEGNPTSSGVLVTRIKLKQANRYFEALLQSAETWACIASLAGMKYPRDQFFELWWDMALNQFHDCITGTHMNAVYDEIMDRYEHIDSQANKIQDEALDILIKNASDNNNDNSNNSANENRLHDSTNTSEKSGGCQIIVFNHLSWPRSGLVTVKLPADCLDGRSIIEDKYRNKCFIFSVKECNKETHITFFTNPIPSIGYASYQIVKEQGALSRDYLINEQPGEHLAEQPKEEDTPIRVDYVSQGNMQGTGREGFCKNGHKKNGHVISEESNSIENEYYLIKVGQNGIKEVVDKVENRVIANSGDYFPGELILEEDRGTPWGTKEEPRFTERLSPYCSVSIKDNVIYIKGEYKGKHGGVNNLSWKQKTYLIPGSDMIYFATDIDWDTKSCRLKVAFSFDSNENEAFYEVPYANIKRSSYNPIYGVPNGASGDWPTLNWVDVALNSGGGVALINKGLPANRVENGTVFLSPLRSPEETWCLNEPEFYDCGDYDGMMDVGHHKFEYALYAHGEPLDESAVVKKGYEYNNPLVARGMDKRFVKKFEDSQEETGKEREEEVRKKGNGERHAENYEQEIKEQSYISLIEEGCSVVITALKMAEDGEGIILRLYESSGRKGAVEITLPLNVVNAVETDLYERPIGKCKHSYNKVYFSITPFQIKTLRVQLKMQG